MLLASNISFNEFLSLYSVATHHFSFPATLNRFHNLMSPIIKISSAVLFASLLVPGSLSRPADIYVPHWIDGRKLALDVSVTSPTQEALLHRAAEIPATAIEARKASKNRTHFEHCQAQGVFFQPLVVETFGGWDPIAVDFLKKMATQEARRWGKTPALEIKHFFQRLSIALQRGNSALLIARDIEPV